jgi:PilZ domain
MTGLWRERERRDAVRHDAHVIDGPTVCRVNPGDEVRLINISSVGALVESAFPLWPGRSLQLHVQGRSRRTAIEARVVRCAVIAVTASRGVRFAAGLAFSRRLDLGSELDPSSSPS